MNPLVNATVFLAFSLFRPPAVLIACHQFRSPPVGPIGASIQLKEEYKEFRVCIEGHLSRSLNNFVVSCHQ